MPRAVRFDHYGGTEVLQVFEVPRPEPGPEQLLIRVRAAGINPGEAMIREGALDEVWPARFPSGQGSDLAGVIEGVGEAVAGWHVGEEVIGFTDDRGSQAEFVIVEAENVTARPPGVPWEVAGGLFVAGATAWAAVRAVALSTGETVVVSGAAGGVGTIAVQLAKLAGADVIGLASEANHEWLAAHGVVPVSYGDGVADRIRASASGAIHAFIDTFGAGYVDLALGLGVAPERIDTIADPGAAEVHGVKTDGSQAGASADVLAELAGLIEAGKLEVPIAAVYTLDEVREAYQQLEQRHTRGKIVLTPSRSS